VLIEKTVYEVRTFKYLGRDIHLIHFNHFKEELSYFQYVFGTIKRTLLVGARTEILLKMCIVTAVLTLLFGSERWTLNIIGPD
jgi:hypothetical protein